MPPSGRQRAVRVFVSSTFLGMQRERERLVKFAFPELRRRCRERRIEFLDVDLRWGITEEQRGEVLPICLHEIDLCRPYFIGVLGDRYGTVFPSLPARAVAEHPWLAAFPEASVTELEMRYGALNAPNDATRAFFYLGAAGRADDRDAAIAVIDPRLTRLRDAIRASGLPLREDYQDAPTLGDWVVEDLWRAIDADFPDDPSRDELDRIAEEHEAFAAASTTTYVARPDLFGRLDDHVRGHTPPLAVLGGVGAGKTALLANWVARRRSTSPDEFVLVHYIGCTPESTEVDAMLRRICAEIARRHGVPAPVPGTGREAKDEFPRWLSVAGERGRLILVLDGLDQLESSDAADLSWLPVEPPAGVRVIVSLRDEPGSPASPVRESLARRAWTTLEIHPLQTAEIRELATRFFRRHGKALTATQVAALTERVQASNPLFLTVLLEDLRVFWSHELLDRQLALYLDAPDAERLYELVLERLDGDYADGQHGLVALALSLIWAARQGLSESELSLLLAFGHGTPTEAVPRAVWAPMRYALGGALVSRSGLLGFAHAELRRAVEARYLGSDQARRAHHKMLGDFFTIILFRDTLPEMIRRDESAPIGYAQALDQLLVEQAATMTRDERAQVELPWQWEQAGEWWRLRVVLTHPRIISTLYGQKNRLHLARYWRALDGHYDVVDAYDEVLGQYEKHADPRTYGLALGAIGSLLRDLARYGAAERILVRGVEQLERCNVEPVELWMALGHLCHEVNRDDQARVWHARALAALERFGSAESSDTAGTLVALAVDHFRLGDLEQAEQLLDRAIALETERYGADSYMLAECLGNLAQVRQGQRRYADARELYGRAMSLCERRFGRAHYAVATVIQNLGDLDRETGDYQTAIVRFRQAGAIVRETLGRRHRIYAATLLKQSEALEGLESYAEAIPLLRETLEIRRAMYAPGSAIVVDCLTKIIDVQMAQGEFESARTEARDALGELEQLADVPPRSLERLRIRLSNIDDILGYRADRD